MILKNQKEMVEVDLASENGSFEPWKEIIRIAIRKDTRVTVSYKDTEGEEIKTPHIKGVQTF